MEMNDLYGLVLALGMIGIVTGIILAVLGKLSAASGLTNKAELGVNKTIDALYDIPNSWLGVVIIVAIASIILFMVMRFSGGGSR